LRVGERRKQRGAKEQMSKFHSWKQPE
jgi:hypothetical protein